MTSLVTHLKRIIPLLALAAALVTPGTAVAGKPETRQFAIYLSGILPPKTSPDESGWAEAKQFAAYLKGVVNSQPSPAESARAETKQIAAYLSGIVGPRPTRAESGQAETKAFADFLRVTLAPSYPTPAESSQAETKAFANALRLAMQPRVAIHGAGSFGWVDRGMGAATRLAVVLLIGCLGAGLAIWRHHRRQVAGM